MQKFLASVAATAVAFSLAGPAMASHDDHDDNGRGTKAEVKFSASAKVHAGTGSTSVQDLACMQTAVEKRETAIIAALVTYTNAWKTSLETRKTELNAAWGITNNKDRRNAINAAWKKFREARKEQRRAFRDARKSAWKQFKTDAKACKVQNLDQQGESADNDND